MHDRDESRRSIAVIGAGISGLAAAWLLAQKYDVTVFEAEARPGGHSNTVDVASTPVDTGFIVYNETTYPNLTALFAYLGVPTKPSDMSFGISLDEGRLEYAGTTLDTLFAQRRNLASPRFWMMLRDLVRFYRSAPHDLPDLDDQTLATYLDGQGYGEAFRSDHLYPMAAAIWSTPAHQIGAYPAAAFIRFCETHGLLKLADRPIWRTVEGGSRAYVARLAAPLRDRLRTGCPVLHVRREDDDAVEVATRDGRTERFDDVVIATHADQALQLLADPSRDERRLLGTFSYSRARAVLHSDTSFMPKRRKVWSSWNYVGPRHSSGTPLCVTYWMNRLQGLPAERPLFVTLNPTREPAPATVHYETAYTHPAFDAATLRAQRQLWSLQNRRRTWFCGAYFGAGFHEDGLQAGLAVAEQLGGLSRPWDVAEPSGRITVTDAAMQPPMLEAAS